MEASDTWLDYVTSIGTLLASIAALAAVGITLYLNVWRERHRQPVLSLHLAREAHVGAGYTRSEPSGPTVVAPVNVSNASGKRSAHAVEVLLSAGYWLSGIDVDPKFHETIHQEPLTWWISDPPQGTGQATANIPPGVTKKVAILFSGHPATLYESLDPRDSWGETQQQYIGTRLGVFTVVPLSQETVMWLTDQLAYEIRLTVVADDVDAISYRTRLRWSVENFGEGDETILVRPIWDELCRVDPAEWPGELPEDTSGRVESKA